MTVTYDCITKKSRLETEDLMKILNQTDNLADYMFMNYLEREIVRQNGQDFLINSSNKVQYLMGFLMREDYEGVCKMYNGSFDIYMSDCNHDIAFADGFNIVFLVLIHMAKKILRKAKDFN